MGRGSNTRVDERGFCDSGLINTEYNSCEPMFGEPEMMPGGGVRDRSGKCPSSMREGVRGPGPDGKFAPSKCENYSKEDYEWKRANRGDDYDMTGPREDGTFLCPKGMGCNNSGGPDKGGWDAGFGADGSQLGMQSMMVDTITALNNPRMLANKVAGTGRTLNEHWGSWLDKNGYLTHATQVRKEEDATDATEATWNNQLEFGMDGLKARRKLAVLAEPYISGRMRKHGTSGGWH